MNNIEPETTEIQPQVIDKRRHNFSIIDNEIIDVYAKEIGPHGVALYVTMVRKSGADGTLFNSIKTLAEDAGMSYRKAVDLLKIFHDLGLIKSTKRRRKNGSQTSSLYEILPVK